jgi:hypothetical protein
MGEIIGEKHTFLSRIALGLLLIVFWGFSIFIAINLNEDIVPDEPVHFEVSLNFAQTWGIPDPEPYTEAMGIFISRTPFLAYWLYGRTLNLVSLIHPTATRWQQLVYLRLFNTLFSVGTVIFVFLLSKELIKNKWWQLLPVFTLTNSLMFVLLAGGVSYDNPANMFSAAGIYFLLRVLKKKSFTLNSIGWMIFIALGTWTKETILPLALVMTVVWVIFIIKNKSEISVFTEKNFKTISLTVILILVITVNFSIYGINLIRYQSVTPSCRDHFADDFCRNTPQAQRRTQLALPEKPNMIEAFRQGYPEPIRYGFDIWIRAMLMKIFGIMGGQKSYYPINITYFHILFYWMIALAIRYFRKTTFTIYSLTAILAFYTITLFIKNYDTDLAYGFIQVAHQGRYIFPVISIIFCLFSYGLFKVPNKWIRYGTLTATLFLFLYSGPIRFILQYQTTFAEWFI